MPDVLRDFLYEWRDTLWYALLGCAGGITTILVLLGAGRPVSKPTAFAAVLAGAILAVTSTGLVGTFFGVEFMKGAGLGGCAYIMGMLGLSIATTAANIRFGSTAG